MSSSASPSYLDLQLTKQQRLAVELDAGFMDMPPRKYMTHAIIFGHHVRAFYQEGWRVWSTAEASVWGRILVSSETVFASNYARSPETARVPVALPAPLFEGVQLDAAQQHQSLNRYCLGNFALAGSLITMETLNHAYYFVKQDHEVNISLHSDPDDLIKRIGDA